MINLNIETENLIVRPFKLLDAEDASDYSQKSSVAYWMIW